jgi:hypothetical protein
MAEDNWMFVERFGGRLRRVTVLDERFHVIATHDRGPLPGAAPSKEDVPDECQLLKAVQLERPG